MKAILNKGIMVLGSMFLISYLVLKVLANAVQKARHEFYDTRQDNGRGTKASLKDGANNYVYVKVGGHNLQTLRQALRACLLENPIKNKF